jgi:ApaG protein
LSDTTTRGIRIQVDSSFIDERSDSTADYFFFSYHVTISNAGEVSAQLISRTWIITDANGHVEKVQGPGVVGLQPVLMPGTSFEYTSFCPLRTTMGTMHGHYTMRSAGGEMFDAEIGPFTLAVPNAIN